MFLALALIAGLATGCGSEAPSTSATSTKGGRPATPVVTDIGKLIPADAVAVVYAPSLDDLVTKMQGVAASISPQLAQGINRDKIQKQFAYLDGSRPIALCASLSGDGEATGVMIYPVTDVEKASAIKGGPPRVMSGDYVSMFMGQGTPPTPSATTHRLLEAPIANDITIRIDVAAITAKMSSQIDDGIREMGRQADRMGPAGDMFREVQAKLGDMVRSADIADLGLTISGSTVDAYASLSVKEGSTLDQLMPAGSGNANTIAQMLPEGFPISGVMHFDAKIMTDLMDSLVSMMEKAAPEQAGDFATIMRTSMDVWKSLGPNHGFAAGLGNGMQMVVISDVKGDPAAALAQIEGVYQSEGMKSMGMTVEKQGDQKINGIDVHTYHMTMDMAKLMEASSGRQMSPRNQARMDKQMKEMMSAFFGGEKPTYHLATVSGKIIIVMGDLDLMTRAIQSATSANSAIAPGLAKAIKSSGGTPTLAVEFDLRRLIREGLALAAKIAPDGTELPVLGEGAPARIVVYGGRDGRTYRGGFSVDVGELAKVFKALDR